MKFSPQSSEQILDISTISMLYAQHFVKVGSLNDFLSYSSDYIVLHWEWQYMYPKLIICIY